MKRSPHERQTRCFLSPAALCGATLRVPKARACPVIAVLQSRLLAVSHSGLGPKEMRAMSQWNSAEWAALCSGVACPICRRLRSGQGPHAPIIVLCRITPVLVINPTLAVQSVRDVQRVSRAIHELTRPVKLNYEIHGNTIPHLHMHLYPRHRGDPFEGRAIDPKLIKVSPYQVNEFANFVAELRARMSAG